MFGRKDQALFGERTKLVASSFLFICSCAPVADVYCITSTDFRVTLSALEQIVIQHHPKLNHSSLWVSIRSFDPSRLCVPTPNVLLIVLPNSSTRISPGSKLEFLLKTQGLSLVIDFPFFVILELDDGAYNPLWTMRGFTQTFHFWKETKRAQSVPLNAYLTYITLPWWSIAKGKRSSMLWRLSMNIDVTL